MEHWANKYIGIPYKRRGRGMDGMDCWGLLISVMEEHGIEVPELNVSNPALMEDNETDALAKGWHRVNGDHAQALDVVRLNTMHKGRIIPFHVGVHVDHDKILHIDGFGIGSACVEERKSGGMKWRILETYRASRFMQ